MGKFRCRSRSLFGPRAAGVLLCNLVFFETAMAIPPNAIRPVVQNAVALFDLNQVRLTDGPFKETQDADQIYLLELDADRLLADFRREAGLPPRGDLYPGWESRGIAGHTLGHYLSALAQMYQSTGDDRLRQRVDYLVRELAEVQRKNGDGYVGAIPDGRKHFAVMVKSGSQARDAFTLDGMWVPWYTQHKIFAGLIDAYELCGNASAKDVVIGLTDWCEKTLQTFDDERMQNMLKVEHGGMAESIARVYALTGEPRYLALAKKFKHAAVFDPAAAGRDGLDRIHANTQIPKFIGYDYLYELTGDKPWGTAARNFWTFVARDRSFALGGNSTREHFFPFDKFAQEVLEFQGPETCNTYNMLKLTERLFCETPQGDMADYYERALYNHILASHLPHSPGAFTYFTTMRPGGYRGYSKPFDDFWCCVGTGMENSTRFGRFIFAQEGSSKLLVNLFIPSQLTWGNVTVRQENNFPAEPRTRLTFNLAAPKSFKLALRHPKWVEANALQVSVNGQALKVTTLPSAYVEFTREWEDGDVVTVELPMTTRVEPLAHAPEYAAIFHGPILLAGELGSAGLTDADFYAHIVNPGKGLPLADVPVILAAAGEIPSHVKPLDGRSLYFQLTEIVRPCAVDLEPFYALHKQRYNVYWRMMSAAAYTQSQKEGRQQELLKAQLTARVVDEVSPGEQQPEVDHNLESERSNTGHAHDRTWRDARDGGWFGYTLAVLPDQPMTLRCTYWGGDAGQRTFDVLVDHKMIATEHLENSNPTRFVDVDYPLPQELTAGKNKVTVRFQCAPGSIAGGVFSIVLMKP